MWPCCFLYDSKFKNAENINEKLSIYLGDWNNLKNKTIDEVETMLVSEYDAGDVELEQLVDEEGTMSNYNNINVVTHESLDDIVEHLEGVEIIGDLPEEVKL